MATAGTGIGTQQKRVDPPPSDDSTLVKVEPMPQKPSMDDTIHPASSELRNILLKTSWSSLVLPSSLVLAILLLIVGVTIFSK
jgi:hypothetical protein